MTKIKKLILGILAIGLVSFTLSSYAENLNFQTANECKSRMQQLYDSSSSAEGNQWMYQGFFKGLIGKSGATTNNDCNGKSCVYTAKVGGCLLVKFYDATYINGANNSNILWNQVVNAVQQEINNYNNKLEYDGNHGQATVTCPHTMGQKADAANCHVTLN